MSAQASQAATAGQCQFAAMINILECKELIW